MYIPVSNVSMYQLSGRAIPDKGCGRCIYFSKGETNKYGYDTCKKNPKHAEQRANTMACGFFMSEELLKKVPWRAKS